MQRGFYGTWVHLSSVFWLVPRKTLQIRCTTVCTSKIHPQCCNGSLLIWGKKNGAGGGKALHWLNELNAAPARPGIFGMFGKKKIQFTACVVLEAPQNRHDCKPGGILYCFHDHGCPTSWVLGDIATSVTSPRLPWWEEEASGEFPRRALTL